MRRSVCKLYYLTLTSSCYLIKNAGSEYFNMGSLNVFVVTQGCVGPASLQDLLEQIVWNSSATCF